MKTKIKQSTYISLQERLANLLISIYHCATHWVLGLARNKTMAEILNRCGVGGRHMK